MKRLKGLRIVFISAVVAGGLLGSAYIQEPIRAATQNEIEARANPPSAKEVGAASYATHCAICHGDQREGILPAFPPLIGINHRMTDDKIVDLIHVGKGRMPGFPSLQNSELAALLHFVKSAEPVTLAAGSSTEGTETSGLAQTGDALFQQNCAFCHGRDAMGGETGPDLTESKLVGEDKTGEKITQVIREGRPDKMPGFNLSNPEISGIIAFIRAREAAAAAHPGGRRGVAVADLQTGNVQAGKQYFDGSGGCVNCHSPSGDLAGVATRFEGLQLEERMLYPRNAKSTVSVKLATGETISGILAYRDEFTIALRDRNGIYRSWPINPQTRVIVSSPVDAHVLLFNKYTDDDIHNLMAYLQTLR